jgi:hypothetical protein
VETRQEKTQAWRGQLAGAGGFEPAADVDLGVGFAAIVARAGRVGGFLGPLEDGQLRTAAVDDKPANGIPILLAADFTSIDGVDRKASSR